MGFYERVEELRKKTGLSQGKLEKELGFSNGSISKWKNSIPTYDRLQKISGYFNVSVDYLRTGEEKQSSFSIESAKLVAKIRADKDLSAALIKYFELPDEKKKFIIDTINIMENK